MATPEEVASHLLSLVGNSRDQKMTGVELAILVRHKFHNFSPEAYGCRNLRAFIRSRVPTLTEAGRAGADIVYGVRSSSSPLKGSTSEAVQPTLASVAQTIAEARPNIFLRDDVWKAFSSPVSPFKLYANSETGALETVPPGSVPPQAPWVHIPPCSAEVHQQIAKDFAANLPVPDELSRKSLESVIGQFGPWWRSYYMVIQRLGLSAHWNQYRRPRILREFEAALKERNVPLTGMSASKPTRPPGSQIPAIQSSAEDSTLRSLAIEVVRNMQISELRELRVPLGYVIDALGRKRI